MDGYGERALVVLAAIAVIFLLHYGAPFFIPLLVALLISYALAPVVDVMTRVLRWRVLSAFVVIAILLGIVGLATWAWADDARAAWIKLPEAARTISRSLQRAAVGTGPSPVAEVKKAAAELESIASTGKAPVQTGAPQPAAQTATTSFWSMVWTGGKGVFEALTQVMVVLFLVFFMLASGDLFKRKLVRIFGDSLSEKRVTVKMIDEIDEQIRRYLAAIVVSNVLVGLGTWIVFRVTGMEYSELWGVVAAVLHTVPYFGPALIAAVSLVVAFLQFGDWPHALLVSGLTIVVATLVGSIFGTWLASRQTQMNTTAAFVGLLFFGWIWGFWGVLLAIPLLAIVKTICDHNEDWKSVSELLSQ